MHSAPPRGGWSVREHGLTAHLRDAIRLNRARRLHHARVGGPRAFALSTVLIYVERALLPVARVLDRQAAPFVEAGVPILVADLAPLPATGEGACSTEDGSSGPPAPRGGSGFHQRRSTRRAAPMHDGRAETVGSVGLAARRLASREGRGVMIGARLGAARQATRGGHFHEAAGAIRDALRALRDAEASEGQAYALTAHVLESAGRMALRAPAYAEATDGGTAPLSRRLVRGHLALVPMALRLDVAAHSVQARGGGLFVDDLPPIPFEAEHDAHA